MARRVHRLRVCAFGVTPVCGRTISRLKGARTLGEAITYRQTRTLTRKDKERVMAVAGVKQECAYIGELCWLRLV